MTNDSTLAAHSLAALLARWEARSRDALPADAMLVNLHVRELREALSAPGAAAAAATLPALNDHLVEILGRPNFQCITIAEVLRHSGQVIKHKAENEQAAVLHYLLGIYLQHGADWWQHASEDLRARATRLADASEARP